MALEKDSVARQVKVALRSPDGSVETLWADDLGGGRYRLDNTPWYAYGISWLDVVEATPDADGKLRFQRVVEKSGHRTVRITAKDPFSDEWLQQIIALGCTYEGDLRLIPVATLAVSSHGSLNLGELTDEDPIHRRADHRHPA